MKCMTSKSEKKAAAEQIEAALDAYETATPEERNDFSRGAVSDVAHGAVRKGLQLLDNDPHDPQVLYSRGFVNHDDPESWTKAVRVLIDELQA